jgi:HEAT repeat protein
MTTSTPTSADVLITALHEPGREHLLDLVRNPLRLTLLCMTWDGSSLPETQAELYDRYLKAVYQWNRNLQELRDHAQRCGTNITNLKRDLNRQLGELAKAALNLPQERFRLSQALVENYLGEELDETSLGYLALRLGWLNRVGRDGRGDAIFAFYHATFQEYFAALAVPDWDYFLPRNHVDCPVEGKRYRIFEPQWKQVILLWLGREDIEHEEKEEFIQALVEFKGGAGVTSFYFYQAYFLAAAGINEFKVCSLAAEIVWQLVQWGFGEFDIEKQEWQTFFDPIKEGARKAIPETIRWLTITELIAIIENCPDEDTLRQAVKSLETIGVGNPEVLAGLIEVIRTTENEDIRGRAAESLGKIGVGNSEAIAGVLEVLRTTKNGNTRARAAESLGGIGVGNPEAITGVLQIIRTTENEDTRREALESLGKIDPGNPEAIAGLLELLLTTEDEDTHDTESGIQGSLKTFKTWFRYEKAAESLGKIGVGNLHAIAGVLEIIRTTENEDTRRRAAESLGKIDLGNPEAINGVLEIIRMTDNQDTRRRAAESLGKIGVGNLHAIAGVLEIIRMTDNQDTCRRAAESLGEIGVGNLHAIAGVLEIIRMTDNEDTRREALKSLGEISARNPDVINGLIAVIRTTEDEDTRREALKSLGKIDPGNPEAINGLIAVIRMTDNEYTRSRAAVSLGEIDPGNPEAIAGLIEVIRTTEDEDARITAASSLDEIDPGNPEAIAGVLQLIHSIENEDTIRIAAWSLEKIDPRNPETIAGLVEVIRMTVDEFTLSIAARSLEKIGQGNIAAIAGLVEVIRTTADEDTCSVVARSLEKILTIPKQYAWAVSALKDNISDEVWQNDFKRFNASYKVLWNCAENLPYPEFYQAWHHPTTTPHPEVTEQTPNKGKGEQSFASPITCESLQHLPVYCLNAALLASETREGEIALTISELIWQMTCPEEDPPEPATPAELRRALSRLQRRNLLPHRAILFAKHHRSGGQTFLEPIQPTPSLITFCEKLTGVIAIAFLTDEPLEAPLKGFPPNQPNLISAIEAWLEEI